MNVLGGETGMIFDVTKTHTHTHTPHPLRDGPPCLLHGSDCQHRPITAHAALPRLGLTARRVRNCQHRPITAHEPLPRLGLTA